MTEGGVVVGAAAMDDEDDWGDDAMDDDSAAAAVVSKKLPNRVRVGYPRRVHGGATVRAINMDGDGNCMFRALAHQLDGGTSTSSEEMHATVRLAVADYAGANCVALSDEFAPFLRGIDWQRVVTALEKNCLWNNAAVDIVVPPIAARVLGRVVRIVQRDVPPQEYRPWPEGVRCASGEAEGAPLVIFRHEDHFWSVRSE